MVSVDSIDLVVLGGHRWPRDSGEFPVREIFRDRCGVRWFRDVADGRKVDLDGRSLIRGAKLSWNLFGEDRPSQIGERAADYLDSPPEGTEVVVLNYDGWYATRSGYESVNVRFYGSASPA